MFDTSGNFAMDSVDVEVTHDYAFLAELFEQIGQALQEAIPEIPVTVSIPFLEDGLSDVIDLTGTFFTIADMMYGDVKVTGDAVGFAGAGRRPDAADHARRRRSRGGDVAGGQHRRQRDHRRSGCRI